MAPAQSEKIPKAMHARFDEIVALTDSFASAHLNAEYKQLIRYAVAGLCRKRPSPLASGRPTTWACGVTHAVGTVNFLFDPSQTPHIKVSDLYQAFGVSQSVGQGKSKQVRDTLDMAPLDPKWTLPSRIADNPMVWLVMVDGLVVDIRKMPLELQEAAFAKGLIPYVPARDPVAETQ
jgi:hypothetical protein